jgi:ankyrin repeat protein
MNFLKLVMLLSTISAIPAFCMEQPKHAKSILEQQHSDIMKLFLEYILTSEFVYQDARTIKALASTNRFFNRFINRPDVLKFIIKTIRNQHIDLYETYITDKFENMKGMHTPEIRQWRAQREKEIPLENQLLSAVNDNDLRMVQELATQGVNVNIYNSIGYFPLINAVINESLEMTQLLLGAGASVNLRTKDAIGVTALYTSAECKDATIAATLIAAKADLNLTTKSKGTTPLDHAAVEGNMPVVQLLIIAGAHINKQNKKGYTPLMHAAHLGHKEILASLLSAGAKIDIQDNEDSTALIWAVYNNQAVTTKMLLAAGANKDVRSKEYGTALELARKNRNAQIEQLLQAHETQKTMEKK